MPSTLSISSINSNGSLRLTVHLVDKGKNRDVAHNANLEQLDRLRLDTLGTIDDHNRRIGCHQGTVGILREILMSWCIQNIDAESVIIKLQIRKR